MTWLPVDAASGESERAAVLGLAPAAYAAHRAFLDTCQASTDPALLRVCKARMAQLLGCREELANYDQSWLTELANWDNQDEDKALPQAERDAIAFVEQFLLDPSLVSAEQAGALEAVLGTRGVIDFTTVIASYEASLRLATLFDFAPHPNLDPELTP